MQVSVESTSPIARRMTVTVPADELEHAIAKRLQQLSGQLKMPGFRPGKVPMKVVEAQYGGRVMQEVSGELIQSSYRQALGKESLHPASGPKIEPKSLERGKALEYIAEFDVYPDIPHLDLAGKGIERPVCTVSDEDIDSTIETMRKQRVSWSAVEREARADDRVTLDFTGTIDGEEFEGGKAEGFQVVLGASTLLKDFEQGLLGVKPGEERTLDVSFPKEYQASELAGKNAKFAVKVREVAESQLPELNEDFIRQMGTANGSLEAFREEVKSSLEREAKLRQRGLLRHRVLEKLLEINDFEIPTGLVEEEISRLRQRDRNTGQVQGAAAEPQAYEQAARQRVAIGLILAEIIKSKGIDADPEQVRARVQELAVSYEDPAAFVRWHYEKPGRLGEIEAVVLEEQVVDAMLEEADVQDKAVSFQELIQLANSSREV